MFLEVEHMPRHLTRILHIKTVANIESCILTFTCSSSPSRANINLDEKRLLRNSLVKVWDNNSSNPNSRAISSEVADEPTPLMQHLSTSPTHWILAIDFFLHVHQRESWYWKYIMEDADCRSPQHNLESSEGRVIPPQCQESCDVRVRLAHRASWLHHVLF